MYNEYWGLGHNPFRNVPDPAAFFPARSHEEALARMCFLVEENKRGGLLLGAPGTGKSLVLQVFAEQMKRQHRRLAIISHPAFDGREVFYDLCAAFSLNPSPTATKAELWRALSSLVRENRYQELHTIVVVDDAHMLVNANSLTDCQLLFNLDENAGAMYTVVFVGKPGLAQAVLADDALTQSFDLTFSLDPLGQDEIGPYVEHRLSVAGRESPAFEPDAVAKIYQYSRGVPSNVNHLCDLALLGACGQELPLVTVDVVDNVQSELSTEAAAQRAARTQS